MKKYFYLLLILSIGKWCQAQCYPDRHNTSWNTAWKSCTPSANPNSSRGVSHWIMYDLGAAYTLGTSNIWNLNDPDFLNDGIKDVIIDYSVNGTTWVELGQYTLEQATGKSIYEGSVGPDFQGRNAQFVLITAVNNYGGSCFGLSEVRLNIGEEQIYTSANLRVMLGGPYDENTGLMHDSLRQKNLIPLIEPYSMLTGFTHVGSGGGERVLDASVFDNVNDEDDIVDWVFVELRDKTNNAQVVATKSALIQRDGDVVNTDGISKLKFDIAPDQFFIAVRHRNHLGVCTANPTTLYRDNATTMDFSSSSIAKYGNNAVNSLPNSTEVLWSGDVAHDGNVKYTGSNNDRVKIFQAIGGVNVTAVLNDVYQTEDVNMDGIVKYTGSNNDRVLIFSSIGGVNVTNVITEQLPN